MLSTAIPLAVHSNCSTLRTGMLAGPGTPPLLLCHSQTRMQSTSAHTVPFEHHPNLRAQSCSSKQRIQHMHQACHWCAGGGSASRSFPQSNHTSAWLETCLCADRHVHPFQCFAKKPGCVQVDAYTPFSALLPHLWALWELVLLAEPLLVLAPSPGHPLLK